jgi:PAS domain S-box-containing protein
MLEESEQRYRNVIEDQTEFICRFLPDGTHVFVNDAYCRHFGMPPEEIIGHRFRPKIPIGDRDDVKRFFASLTPDHPIDVIEHRIIMPDGSLRWQRWSDRAIFDHSGTVTGYQSVGRDITEEKATRIALVESEEKFRSFVENANDIIFSMTPAGIFTYLSPRLKELLGYHADELIGRSFKDFIHPDDLPAYHEFAQQKRRPQEKKNGIDYRVRHKNGTWFWHTTMTSVIRDARGNVISYLGISRDISEHRRSEEALRQANRQLSLLSGITRHDILNKITGILGYLQLAETKSSDPDLAGYLEKMKSATTEIQEQIEFTRIYQDLGTNEPQWIEVDAVLPRSAVPATITLTADVRDVELFADPMLEKIFFNLLDNSIRHGQRVTEIRVSLQKSGKDLVVLWEDNGIGIAADEKERIFEQGFGTNTGLGMFLIREILSLTGITIRETGKPGKGTRFEMLVPKKQYRFGSAVKNN